MNAYLNLLRLNGTLCSLVCLRLHCRSLLSLFWESSVVVGIDDRRVNETQEMLDYCADMTLCRTSS